MGAPTVSVTSNDGAPMEAPKPRKGTDRLRSYIDRIVRLEEQRRELAEDVKDIYTEAKHAGYQPATLRKVVKRRLETDEQRAKRQQLQADLEMVLAELGAWENTPLAQAMAETTH